MDLLSAFAKYKAYLIDHAKKGKLTAQEFLMPHLRKDGRCVNYHEFTDDVTFNRKNLIKIMDDYADHLIYNFSVETISDDDIEQKAVKHCELLQAQEMSHDKDSFVEGAKWALEKIKSANQFIPVAPAEQWNLNLNITWENEHGVFKLTNKNGDTFLSGIEELSDFILRSESTTSTKQP